jgi:hypothetical protein
MIFFSFERLHHEGMYNGVTSAFPYACHVGLLLSWRREKEEIES